MAYIASASEEFPTEDEIKLIASKANVSEYTAQEQKISETASWLYGYMPGDLGVWEPVLDLLDLAFMEHFVVGVDIADDGDGEEGRAAVNDTSELIPYFGDVGNRNYVSRWNTYVAYLLKVLDTLDDEGDNALPVRFRARLRYYLTAKADVHQFTPFPTATFLNEIVKLVRANALAMIEVSEQYYIRRGTAILIKH